MKIKHLFLMAVVGAAVTEPKWAQDKDTTNAVLAQAGITPTKVGTDKYFDYPFFQGGLDVFVTRFEGRVAGKEVSGTVSNTPLIGHPSINFDLKR